MKVDQAETVTFTFESPNKTMKMKLTKFDQGLLGIPEQNYSAVIKMPSGEFQRVVRDLSQFGNRLVINCAKDCVKFSAVGNNGTGNIKLARCNDEGGDLCLQVPQLVHQGHAIGKPGLPLHVS